jgi:phage-related protein (TIGR01555 family)
MLNKIRSLVSGVPLLPTAPASPRVAAQDSAPRAEPHWPVVEGPRRGLNISPALLEQLQAMHNAQGAATDWQAKFKHATVAPGTVTADHKPQELAMDSMCDNMAATIGACSGFNQLSGIDFIGYAALSLLSQHPLIRAMVETLADEMTRKWIKFGGRGEEESDAKRAQDLDDATKKFQLKEHFKAAMATTGYMGGAMLFIDMGDDSDTEEGRAELTTQLTLDSAKIPKGKFQGFRLIEPLNCYPAPYNASNPLKKGYYRPDAWMVQGRTVHASRLLRFAQNEVPILLRPSYNFFGVPLAQMALDYVDRFDTVRIAVAKLVKRFSTSILKTDMSQMLNGGGYDDATSLKARALLWSMMGTNDGLMTLDMEGEDFVQVNTPLSGLGDIVSQQLELLAAISRTPAVKLLGISPKGFNATGEYDESNWYDHVASQQGAVFAQPLDRAIKVIQLSEFGKIDKDLTHAFLPLHELSETEKAQNRKSNADTFAVYFDRGVLSNEEERARLAADPDSGYDSLDVDDLPEPPNDPNDTDGAGNAGTAADGEFKEGDHPRDTDGKFGSGGGSSSGGTSAASGGKGGELVGLAEMARTGGNENRTVDVGTVSEEAARIAKEKAGVDIAGFKHTVDMYGVRHAMKRHGSAKAEEKRGQLAITDKDIAAIGDVVNDPDSVVYAGTTKIGRDAIASIRKMDDGTVLVIEEVRTGKKTLAFTSIRKYPATRDASSVARTVSPNVQNDGGMTPIVHDCARKSNPWAIS